MANIQFESKQETVKIFRIVNENEQVDKNITELDCPTSDVRIIQNVQRLALQRSANSRQRDVRVAMLTCIFFIVVLFVGIFYLLKGDSQSSLPQRIPSQSLKAFTNRNQSLKKVFLPKIIPLSPEGEDHYPNSLHKHNQLTFSYPTVGMPEPGKRYNNTPVERSDLVLFDELLNEMLKPYNDTNCRMERFGRDIDGGYLVCSNLLDQSQALVNIGIDGQDSFGCDVTSNYPMPNYQYDCTNSQEPTCETNFRGNLFQSVCVGSTSQKSLKHTFLTLEQIIRRHNLTESHIILKLDSEGSEYEALKSFPFHLLEYIDQILLQLHFGHLYREQWGVIDIVKSLARQFVSVNYHLNNWACFEGQQKQWRRLKAKALEVTLVNKRVIKINRGTRSFALDRSNRRSRRRAEDCQMEV